MRVPRPPVLKVTVAVSIALIAGTTFGLAYRFLWSSAAVDIYRGRLDALQMRYDALEYNYSEAVRKTAVTELVVADGRLTVRVRDIRGVVREIPTDYDPSREIYVDYVVLDGRLWIRRVFDADTAPSQGLVIDPDADQVTWDLENAQVGKAVYRQLGEGRWVVSVTGNGSLGLTRASENVELEGPPSVREYEAEAGEAGEVGSIGPMAVFKHLAGTD